MQQKIKFERRYLNLTTEEKEEIAARIIKFMRECLVIQEGEHEPEKDSFNKSKWKYYYYYFKEGVIKFGESYYNRVYEDKGYQLSDSDLFRDFDGIGGGFDRLKYHIRMNGSKICIQKLIELLGNKAAIIYLETWAKKNVMVGLLLNNVVQELKRREENDKEKNIL